MKTLPPLRRRRPAPGYSIEPLEARIAPASVVSVAAGSLSVIDGVNGPDTITISISGANYHFNDPGGITPGSGATFIDANNVEVLISSVSGSFTVMTTGGNDSITFSTALSTAGDLTVDTGTGTDSITISGALTPGGHVNLTSAGGITFNDAVTLAVNKNLTVSALGTTNGRIDFATANADLAASGTGAISLTTARDIFMSTGGASVTTTNGDITMNANQQLSPTAGGFNGILASASGVLIEATGSGNITMNGRGGIDPSFIFRDGVLVVDATVRTNTGNITMAGIGGQTLDDANTGVVVQLGGVVESTGGGSIDLTGTGGGRTAGAGNIMYGIRVLFGGTVRTTGTGAITLTGTGGAVGAASDNAGIRIDNGSFVTNSGSGTITFNGTGGANDATGFMTDSSNNLIGFNGTNPYSGNIVINADRIDISSAGIATTGTVTLRQITDSRPINLGDGDAPSILALQDVEMDRVTAGTLQIGDSNSGAITVATPLTPGNNLSLTTGAGIAFNSPVTMAVNKSLTTSALGTSDGTIRLDGGANADLTASGTGAISLTTVRDIMVTIGAEVTTENGNLTLSANAAGTTTGSFSGVDVNGGLVQATGTGVVSVTGQGGDFGIQQFGVIVQGGGDLIGGTSGTMIVSGTGGASSSDVNSGVLLTGFGSTMTSGGANVSVTGQGGGNAGTAFNIGVFVGSGFILSAGGSGSVTVLGTGGVNAGNANFGLRMEAGAMITSSGGNVSVTGVAGGSGAGDVVAGVYAEDSTITAGAAGTVSVAGDAGTPGTALTRIGVDIRSLTQITSAGGNVQVTGTGGASSGANGDGSGVRLIGDGRITAGGTGTVMVTGTGGAGANSAHQGVFVDGSGFNSNLARIGAANGATTLTATAGNTSSVALLVGSSTAGRITTGSDDAIVINADSISVGSAGIISSGTATTTINTRTAGTLIDLGGPDVLTSGPFTLGLTDPELDRITAGTLTIGNNNSGAITVSAALTPTNHLSLTTGAGVTFNQAVTMAVDKNFTVNALGTADGTINFGTTNSDLAASGTGAISLTTARNVFLSSGSSITTVNGNLDVSANQQVLPTSGDFTGVFFNGNGVIQATGAGLVTVVGKGGDGTAVAQNGVQVAFGGSIVGGTSGPLTVQGFGGVPNVNSVNFGVIVDEVGSAITSGGADVNVTGLGGYGVTAISDGLITSGGAATVTVTGTGLNDNSIGVYVAIGSQITSGGAGAVRVEGTASGNGAFGIYVSDTSLIASGGIGAVTVIGTAGVGTGSLGVDVISGGTITSGGGTVGVTGIATPNNVAVRIENAGTITSGSNAAITVTTDSLDIPLGTINSGSGTTTLRQRTAGTLIDLGGADVLSGIPRTLGLTDAELAQVTASTLFIGDGTSVAITVSAPISHGNHLSLTTGTDVTFNDTVTLAVNKNLTVTAGATGTVTVGATLAVSGTGAIQLTGQDVTGSGNIATGGGLTVSNTGTASTLAGVISGTGGLTKVGAGTLVLANDLNSFGPAAVSIFSGTLQVATDGALGDPANEVIIYAATLHTTASFASARHIDRQGAGMLQIDAGNTLTLIGVIDGPGTLTPTGLGTLSLLFVYPMETNNVATPGNPVFVGGTSVAVSGGATATVHTVGGNGTKIDTIELTGTDSHTNLIIKGPGTINRIISNGDLGSIVLGTGVLLGDGVHDSVPDLEITGKASKLQLYDLNSYVFIDLGANLPYDAPDKKISDTYNNHPDLKIHSVTGPGVLIDVTGDGLPSGVGGGGLGKVAVGEWGANGASFPGVIRTTQSITSFILKTGDCGVTFEVDKEGVGQTTPGNVGTIKVLSGSWTSTGNVIDGYVGLFDVGGFTAGADLRADYILKKFLVRGTFTDINGVAYGGTTILDRDVTSGAFNISVGDFTGKITAAGAIGKFVANGTFSGALTAKSIVSITADEFLKIGATGPVIKSTGGAIGSVTTKFGGIANTTIESATNIGNIISKGSVTGSKILAGADPDNNGAYIVGDPTPTGTIGTLAIAGILEGSTIAAKTMDAVTFRYPQTATSFTVLPVGVSTTLIALQGFKTATVGLKVGAAPTILSTLLPALGNYYFTFKDANTTLLGTIHVLKL